jgi:hypothetical protein
MSVTLHGMEEVIGSIPIRSTNYFKHLEAPPFRDFVASLPQTTKHFANRLLLIHVPPPI